MYNYIKTFYYIARKVDRIPTYNYIRKFWYDVSKLQKYRDIHKGDTVFCVGSGPSLDQENLRLLSGRPVIWVNNSYNYESIAQPDFSYWFVHDDAGLWQFKELNRSRFNGSFRSFFGARRFSFSWFNHPFKQDDVIVMPKLLSDSSKLLGVLQKPDLITSAMMEEWVACGDLGHRELLPLYQRDILEDGLYPSRSVIFAAIQLAIYMGAIRIVLLGTDFNYSNSDSYAKRTGRSPNTWALTRFSYNEHIRPYLLLFSNTTGKMNIELINASNKTRDDVLPRFSLDEL